MATAIQQIQDLQDKITKARNRKAEIQAAMPQVQNSLTGPGSGCLQVVVNSPQDVYCTSLRNTMKLWQLELDKIAIDIPNWESQIATLQKDPSVVIALNEAEAANQRKKIWTYVIGGVIIIAVVAFIWWKWIRK